MKLSTRDSFNEAVVDAFTSVNYKPKPLEPLCALEHQESGC